ncbi:MAG TPA: hypothetical protein VMT72_19450 [Pseudolabrys sp.]|nr:hypothetical protein [Pseudolabrys sp.]
MGEEKQKIPWEEPRVKDNESFRELLNRKSIREKLFGEKFIDGLEKRRDAVEERQRKLSVIQITLTFLLAVSVFVPTMPIAVFGLNSSAGSFREFLLVLVGSLPIYGMLGAIEQSRITDAMHIVLQKQADGDTVALRLLKLRYGIVLPFKSLDFSGRTFTLYQKLYLGIGAISVTVWFFLTFVALVSLEFIAIVSILVNPTFSLTISILVCIYVVLLTVSNFGIRALAGISSVKGSPDDTSIFK